MIRIFFWALISLVLVVSLMLIENLTLPIFNWWDKAQHGLCFLVLGCLGMLAYQQYSMAKIIVWLGLYGALIELAQLATGWRYGEIADFVADIAGLLASALIILSYKKLKGENT